MKEEIIRIVRTQEKAHIKEICRQILSSNISPSYIVENLENIISVVYKIFREDYRHRRLPMDHSILIDDIMEMDSISEEEKKKSANEIIMRHMQEYKTLAKDILQKIQQDDEEAEERGFCKILMEQERNEMY